MRICTVEGCSNKYYGLGYCNKHWMRYKKHGHINTKSCRRGDYKSALEAYEAANIKNEDGCWDWMGTRHKNYGTMHFLGLTVFAHRFSYEHHIGPIPDGLRICHHCDNPPCTNPLHLFAGTAKDNTQDCIKKGRFVIPIDSCKVRGSDSPKAKLNEEQVIQIKKMIRDGIGNRTIAKQFNVHHGTISAIRVGKNWRHIE